MGNSSGVLKRRGDSWKRCPLKSKSQRGKREKIKKRERQPDQKVRRDPFWKDEDILTPDSECN